MSTIKKTNVAAVFVIYIQMNNENNTSTWCSDDQAQVVILTCLYYG